MAHKLNFNPLTNKTSFVTRKEKAWHGLGTVVDAMTSEEAIVLGGLDFTVKKVPLVVESTIPLSFTETGDYRHVARTKGLVTENTIYKQLITVDDKYATMRTDTNQVLGVVGSKYHILQNIEAFDFIDSIIGKEALFETVGALGNGETVFITCKLKKEMVLNKDLIEQYLLITTSHDGSSSINVMFTPIRVVCNNTLTAALKGVKNKVVIRHTKNANIKLELAKQLLGIIDQSGQAYEQAFGVLVKKEIKDSVVKDIIVNSFYPKLTMEDELSDAATKLVFEVEDYYYTGVGQKEIVGNGWGVFNAITGYLQNQKSYKNDEAKFKSMFLGTAVDIRNKSMELILAQ